AEIIYLVGEIADFVDVFPNGRNLRIQLIQQGAHYPSPICPSSSRTFAANSSSAAAYCLRTSSRTVAISSKTAAPSLALSRKYGGAGMYLLIALSKGPVVTPGCTGLSEFARSSSSFPTIALAA